MATTQKGIYYNTDYSQAADILEDERLMAESIDETIGNSETDIEAQLATKVDKVQGKGLSTNDFTTEYKNQVDTNKTNIQTNATNIATNTQDINNIKSEQTTQNAKIQTNTDNITALTGRVSTAEGDIGEIKEEQSSQNTSIQNNTEAIEVLQAKNAELEEEIRDLEDNQIPGQATGTEIYISDSAKAKNRRIGITGRSTQESTTGKNKFNALAISRETSPRVTINSDGSELLIDDSATENGYPIKIVSNLCPTLQIGDKIKFTFETNAVRNDAAVNYVYLNVVARTLLKNQVIEVTQDVLDSQIFIYRGQTTGCYYNNFMVLLESETDTSWEKFTYGASPNPNYPQEIKSCGDSGSVNEKVQTKNLFDTGTQKSDYSKQNVINDIVNNEVKINVLSSGNTYTYRFQDFKGNQTYTITAEASAANNRLYVRIRSSDNTRWLTSSDVSLTGWSYNTFYEGWFKEFTTLSIQTVVNIPQCKYCQFGIGYGSISSIINTVQTISNIQIEQGSTATDFVTHQEQTLSFPLEQGQKLMQGDYLADDGIHHVRGEVEITNENVNNLITSVNTSSALKDMPYVSITKTYLKMKTGYYGECILNSYRNITVVSQIETGTYTFNFSPSSIYIFDERFTDLETARQLLLGTVIQYELAEEQTEDFTEEQKEAWEQIKKARTYKGGTHISSEDETPANVDIEYVKDLETVINNLSSAVTVLGGEINV